MAPFSRLVRFRNPAGQIFYGEVPGDELTTKESLQGSQVAVYKGETPFDNDFSLTDQKEEIAEVGIPTYCAVAFAQYQTRQDGLVRLDG